MTLTLPIVEPVAIKLKDKLKHKFAAVEVSNDYGTINLLFLYYVPSLPDDKKSDFDAIQDEFQTWHAWELGQAEAQLNAHVEAGNLPSNDSITSRITRNNYRSKAIGFFRETSEAWYVFSLIDPPRVYSRCLLALEFRLVLAGTSINDKTIETTQDAAIAEITVELKNLIRVNSLQSQFGVIINAITSSIDVANNNKFFFTHVYYRYDSESRKFLPGMTSTL